MCWQEECETWTKAELLVPNKFLGSTMKPQQWELFFNPKSSPNGERIENIDPSPSNVDKSLRLVGRDVVIVKEVYEMLASSFKTVLLHINTKWIQAEEFEKDKAEPTKGTLQIDYSMAYQCKYQDELSEVLWSQESIDLLTCALTHTGPTTTMVICTDYKFKDKFCNGTFLGYLYDIVVPKNDEVKEEIIWSDGPTSEFQNKYMCLWINFLPNITRGFYGNFQQLLIAKELLMGLAVMPDQWFRVNQWTKKRTR